MDHRLILNSNYLLLLLLLRRCCLGLAQSVGPPPSHNNVNGGFSTVTGVIFGCLVVLFFGIAFFSLCFYQRRYVNDITTNRPTGGTAPTTSSESGQRSIQKGVDSRVLETFPIMEYAAVKKLSTVKGPLECAVCLSEFADDDSLRLLPGCFHVFHPQCIDQWLQNHTTCPVCRADLSNPSMPIGDADATSEATGTGTGTGTGTITTEGHEIIQIDISGEPSVVIHTVDRFTLRLPHYMIKEIEESRKYRRSVSIAGHAYDRRGSTNERSGRLRGFIRSFSAAWQREPDSGSGSGSRSIKRVFALTEVAEVPMNSRSIGSSSSGENQGQGQGQRLSNVSDIALLDRV